MATNLEFIKSVTATGGVSIVDITDCFTDKYDVYEIYLTGFDISQTNEAVYLRFLDSGGTVISANEYDYAYLQMRAYNIFNEGRFTAQTYFNIMGIPSPTQALGNKIVIFNPYDSSSYTFLLNQSSGLVTGSGGIGYKYIGVHKVAETITGMQWDGILSDINDFAISVYGVK